TPRLAIPIRRATKCLGVRRQVVSKAGRLRLDTIGIGGDDRIAVRLSPSKQRSSRVDQSLEREQQILTQEQTTDGPLDVLAAASGMYARHVWTTDRDEQL